MNDFTVFIENKNYVHFTLPYLKILKRISEDVQILSLENINISDFDSDRITIFNNKKDLNKHLVSLESKNFFTTTPGIGNFYFQKSKTLPKKNRPLYFYFFHSLVSPNENYSINSFNGYDYILSPNNTISSQLNYLVKENKTKIITVGYQHLSKKNKLQNYKNNILLAPSWGEDNLFSEKYSIELKNLIEELQTVGLNVFLRPHPMDVKAIESFKKMKKTNLYSEKEIEYGMFDFLITDWSGISLEYFFSNNNPVGFVNTKKKRRRKLSRKEKKLELIEYKIIDKIGPCLDLDNLNLEDFLKFKYKKTEYVESLYLPKFEEKKVEELLKKITK